MDSSMVYPNQWTKSSLLAIPRRRRSQCGKYSLSNLITIFFTLFLAANRWDRITLLYRSNCQCFTTWNMCSTTYIRIAYRYAHQEIVWSRTFTWWTWRLFHSFDHCSTIWQTYIVSILVKCRFTRRSKWLVYNPQSNSCRFTRMGCQYIELRRTFFLSVIFNEYLHLSNENQTFAYECVCVRVFCCLYLCA